MLKISMMTYTMALGEWGKKPDVRELCEFTRELELDAIDWVTLYGHDPKEIRRITDGFGLKNICYTFFANVHHPDPAERAKSVEVVKEGMEAARILGADKIMIPIMGLKESPREESRKRAIETLALIVPLGQKAGITVTTEHFPGARAPFVTSADINEALHAIPGLKVTYDNGNVLTGGERPVDGFLNSQEHVVHAHFKDWVLADDGSLGLDGRKYKGTLVGDGLVDPEPCLRAMKAAGYQGYINFEYQGKDLTPREACIRGVRRMRELYERV